MKKFNLLWVFLIFSSTMMAQWSDTTSVILLQFSEPMKIDGLLNTANYKVASTDDNKIFKIHKVGLVNTYKDSTGKTIHPDTSMIVLVTERIPYKKQFKISASNVRDRAGNLINKDHSDALYYNNGYTPDKFPKTMVEIR